MIFISDTNGNNFGVNEGGALTTMSYDKENRMVSYADGSGTTASVYNGMGQKVKPGATTLVWDGWDYLGEVNSGTFDCETFTVDGQILAEKRSGTERLDFERTALGSVCTKYDQTNQARAGVQRYKPCGSPEFHDSTLPTWQWVGSWGYRPTGLSWSDYYVRARHYGTQQAQWTTVDPLWPFQNPFSYCKASPVSTIDYFGLSPNLSTPFCQFLANCQPKSDCFNNILRCMKESGFNDKNDAERIRKALAGMSSICESTCVYMNFDDGTFLPDLPDECKRTLRLPLGCYNKNGYNYGGGFTLPLGKPVSSPPPGESNCYPPSSTDDLADCMDALRKVEGCSCLIVYCQGYNDRTEVFFHEMTHCVGFGGAPDHNSIPPSISDFVYSLGGCLCKEYSLSNPSSKPNCSK